MPGYDGSGPQGTGPNGRGLGPCGEGQTGSRWSLFGFRRGSRGRGRGIRWSNLIHHTEKESLKFEKRRLTEQLDAINKRMDDLQ